METRTPNAICPMVATEKRMITGGRLLFFKYILKYKAPRIIPMANPMMPFIRKPSTTLMPASTLTATGILEMGTYGSPLPT